MEHQSLEHKVVVVVEEAAASRAATEWAAHNFLRPRDVVTLLYVAYPTRSKKKRRTLRLKGFQLALSFHELCSSIPEIKLEIVVKEGDQLSVIRSVVNEIDAGTLVVGLHDHSFLYRMAAENLESRDLRCRIFAVKQQQEMSTCKGFLTIEFTQSQAIENPVSNLAKLHLEEAEKKRRKKS